MQGILETGREIRLRGATKMRVAQAILIFAFFSPAIATAQDEFSIYGGAQNVADRRVSGRDPGGFGFKVGWGGSPALSKPDYGMRFTWWQNQSFGWGVDLNHSQVTAVDQILKNNHLNVLNFSDGLNLITVNAYHRWKKPTRRLSPYLGGGVGLAVPKVSFASGGGKASQYQVIGPAVQWMAGVSYSINERLSLFGEYKGSYSMNSTDLVSGGELNTNVLTSAVNIGVSLGF